MARSRSTVAAFGLLLTAGLVFQAGPVAAAKPEPPLTNGPHPKRPTGAEWDRLVALNDQPPVEELRGDITTMVVTHNVYVKLAPDEEWRTHYGASAVSVANNAIESADNAMYAQFGVNLINWGNANWDSSPDSGPGVNACTLLNDLKADLSPGQADVLIGFAKNYSEEYSGCAELGGDEAEVNWDPSGAARWQTTQHEVSHLFTVPDRYPDPFDSHRDDVMENQFENPDFWCPPSERVPSNDWGIFSSHAGRFD